MKFNSAVQRCLKQEEIEREPTFSFIILFEIWLKQKTCYQTSYQLIFFWSATQLFISSPGPFAPFHFEHLSLWTSLQGPDVAYKIMTVL